MHEYNDIRKQKYKLRSVLKALDIGNNTHIDTITEKNNMIAVDVFVTIASDNQIQLSGKDIAYLKHKMAYQNKINYEEIVKDLALVAVPIHESDNKA